MASKISPMYSILIHYSEIALKKNNRPFFERKFIDNISQHLKKLKYSKIRKISARIFIENLNPDDWILFSNKLKNVMGLKNATLMINTCNTIEDMKTSINLIIKDEKFKNFRITTKRHYKNFEKTSQDINIIIGEYVKTMTKASVNLSSPELNIIIEILKDKSYIGIKQIIGYSGLPAATQEKAFSLISSGIDSPVASFEMIKRGVKVSFIHFHSYPAISKQSIENVKELIGILSNYQLKSDLFVVPFLEVQQKIMKKIGDKFWVIFFRRSMIYIANIIAQNNKGVALITGDSVGQVASQTLSNIRAISEASILPIIRPLAGMNKEDIVNKARKIGTYETSIQPYQDCCSHFVPIHPETKANIYDIKKIDNNLNLNIEHETAIKEMEIIQISTNNK